MKRRPMRRQPTYNATKTGFGFGCGMILVLIAFCVGGLVLVVGGCSAVVTAGANAMNEVEEQRQKEIVKAELVEKERIEKLTPEELEAEEKKIAEREAAEQKALDKKNLPVEMFTATISNKAMGKVNDYEEGVFWDMKLFTRKLKKDTRAVKGVLEFRDLFGDYKYGIEHTITDTIKNGEAYIKQTTGFKYNQFTDSHRWLATTKVKDMKVSFRVKSIIYVDGTTENF